MKFDRMHRRRPASAIRKRNNESGFTLLEVVMAVSIFAVGMLAVAVMQTTAIQSNSFASNLTERVTWAQDKLEDLITMPYTSPNLVSGGPVDPDPPSDYTVQWAVSAGPISNTLSITVTSMGRGKTTIISYIKPRM